MGWHTGAAGAVSDPETLGAKWRRTAIYSRYCRVFGCFRDFRCSAGSASPLATEKPVKSKQKLIVHRRVRRER